MRIRTLKILTQDTDADTAIKKFNNRVLSLYTIQIFHLDHPLSSFKTVHCHSFRLYSFIPPGPSILIQDRSLWTSPDADTKRFETVDTNMSFIRNSHPMFWFCSSSGLKKFSMFCSVLCSAEQNRTLLF